MRYLIPFVFLLLCLSGYSQKTKVYLLGTYHMAGSGDEWQVDVHKDSILGERRQQELESLLDILEKTGVEKIYVENLPERQRFWDSIYSEFYKGKPVQLRNEIHQIGQKLAKRLGIRNGVTCVDWQESRGKEVSDSLYTDYCSRMMAYTESLQLNPNNEFSIYDNIVLQEIQTFDNEIPNTDLLTVIRTLNSPAYLKKMLYINVTTYLDTNTEGTGAFHTQYQMMRNANIYSNIIRDILTERPQKVMVLYGAAHIAPLKAMFEAHPLIEVVMFDELLRE